MGTGQLRRRQYFLRRVYSVSSPTWSTSIGIGSRCRPRCRLRQSKPQNPGQFQRGWSSNVEGARSAQVITPPDFSLRPTILFRCSITHRRVHQQKPSRSGPSVESPHVPSGQPHHLETRSSHETLPQLRSDICRSRPLEHEERSPKLPGHHDHRPGSTQANFKHRLFSPRDRHSHLHLSHAPGRRYRSLGLARRFGS